MRPIQAFAGSFVSIFFVIYLNTLGLPLWQTGLVLSGGLAFSTPQNLVAGIIKGFYDIALWFTFKDIKPPEEED